MEKNVESAYVVVSRCLIAERICLAVCVWNGEKSG